MKVKRIYLMMSLSLFFFTNSMAQFKAYKISNGNRTELKAAEEVTINLDADGKPSENILFVVDLKQLRSKHKFDLMNVSIGRPGFSDGYLKHDLESETARKKYADVEYLNFYAFEHNEYKSEKGSFAVVSEKVFYSQQEMKFIRDFKFIGLFITGQERYYDEFSKSIKFRDVYGEGELVAELKIKFVQNASDLRAALEKEYDKTFRNNFSRVEEDYVLYGKNCARDLRKISRNIPIISMVAQIPKYGRIANAIEEITTYYFNQLKAETDKVKALEMHKAWYGIEGRELFCVYPTKSNEETFKQLDKDLKNATTVEQKIEMIKTALK